MPKSCLKREEVRIICFAGCDWWYHNRGLFCPQVMKRLTSDFKVLFVNSLGMRIPSLRKDRSAIRKIVRKLRSILRFLRRSEEGMWVLSPISLPLGTHIGRKLNTLLVLVEVKLVAVLLGFGEPVVYIGCPPALGVARRLWPKQFTIYERTDLFEAMPGANAAYIAALDSEITRSADLVLYVNKALWKDGIAKNENSLLIGHGVDFDFFAGAAESKYVPQDIADIRRPIIGFYGDISDKTSDLALLEFAVKELLEISFVFVGSISANISRLKRFTNVHFLGQKRYEQIPFYGKEFDVAIMPWNKSRWIEFCNPIKIREYLALGKPVVTTYYPEIEPYSDLVYIADDYDAFVSCIRKAVEERDPVMVKKRRDRVRNETWDNKVEQIKTFIERSLRSKS